MLDPQKLPPDTLNTLVAALANDQHRDTTIDQLSPEVALDLYLGAHGLEGKARFVIRAVLAIDNAIVREDSPPTPVTSTRIIIDPDSN